MPSRYATGGGGGGFGGLGGGGFGGLGCSMATRQVLMSAFLGLDLKKSPGGRGLSWTA